MDGQPQFDISRLSASDRNELNQFLQNETQKSNIQQSTSLYQPSIASINLFLSVLDENRQMTSTQIPICPEIQHIAISMKQANINITAVHHLTEICFKKCITARITQNKLAAPEESCAQNCVNRWMDANLAIVKHLENLRH